MLPHRHDRSRVVKYTCEVLHGSGSHPMFRVRAEDGSLEVVSYTSPGRVWYKVLARIHASTAETASATTAAQTEARGEHTHTHTTIWVSDTDRWCFPLLPTCAMLQVSSCLD